MYWLYFATQWAALALTGVGLVRCSRVPVFPSPAVGILRLDVCRPTARADVLRRAPRRADKLQRAKVTCASWDRGGIFPATPTPAPVVFTDNYVGTYTRQGVRYWRSGTTIGVMANIYKNTLNKAFPPYRRTKIFL